MTEDEMVGWHHRLNGRGFGQAPGVGDGQGRLLCRGPWGRKESDMTERLNNHHNNCLFYLCRFLFSPYLLHLCSETREISLCTECLCPFRVLLVGLPWESEG